MLPDSHEARLIRWICDPVPWGHEKSILEVLISTGGYVTTPVLIDVCWGGRQIQPRNVNNCLGVKMLRLRQRLVPPATVNHAPGGYRLDGVPGIDPTPPYPLTDWLTTMDAPVFEMLRDGRQHEWQALAAARWPIGPWPDSARKIIGVVLWRLKKRLAPGWQINRMSDCGWKLVNLKE